MLNPGFISSTFTKHFLENPSHNENDVIFFCRRGVLLGRFLSGGVMTPANHRIFGPCSEGDFPLVFVLCFGANRQKMHIQIETLNPSEIWDFFDIAFFRNETKKHQIWVIFFGEGAVRHSLEAQTSNILNLPFEFRDGKTVISTKKP